MATNSSKRILVPQAQNHMTQFKLEAANEVGVNLTDYNGELTTRQAGSIGGQMVKKMVYDYQSRHAGGQAEAFNMTQDLNKIKQQVQQSTS